MLLAHWNLFIPKVKKKNLSAAYFRLIVKMYVRKIIMENKCSSICAIYACTSKQANIIVLFEYFSHKRILEAEFFLFFFCFNSSEKRGKIIYMKFFCNLFEIISLYKSNGMFARTTDCSITFLLFILFFTR